MTVSSHMPPLPAHDALPPNANHAHNGSHQANTMPTPFLPSGVDAGRILSAGSQPPLPDAWNFTKPVPFVPARLQPILKTTIDILVMISYGHSSLEKKWELTNTSEKFTEEKKRISDRITVITVVVSMVVFQMLSERLYSNCMSSQVYS